MPSELRSVNTDGSEEEESPFVLGVSFREVAELFPRLLYVVTPACYESEKGGPFSRLVGVLDGV